MIKLKGLIKERLAEDDSASFDAIAKELMDIVWNRHPSTSKLKPFSKDMSTKVTNMINQLYKQSKDDMKGAMVWLQNYDEMTKDYVNDINSTAKTAVQSIDNLEKKTSTIVKQDIDLDDPNAEKQKGVFDRTFRPILDKVKQSYNTLEDKAIVKKLDELIDIVLDNYNTKKYEAANNGATRLIATLFPANKFSMWDNEFTKAKFPNTKVLDILDDYRDIIRKGN